MSADTNAIFSVLNRNLNVFGLGAGAILVGVAIYSGFSWYTEKQELKAQGELALIEKDLNKKKEDFEKAQYDAQQSALKAIKDKLSKNKDKTAEPTTKPATGDLAADYGDIPNRLQAFVSAHPNRRAAAFASLHLAELYSTHKKTDEAVQILQKQLPHISQNEVLYGVLTMKLANVQSLTSCEQAVETWGKVGQSDSFKEFHPEALLRRGLCFEKLAKLDEAKAAYRQVSEKFPMSMGAKTAQKYLLLLEARSGT